MAKKCITTKNDDGEVVVINIPNPSHILNIARSRNENQPLNLTKNGEESILYQTAKELLNLTDRETEIFVARTYSDEFGRWFGRWWEGEDSSKVVDINGQPKLLWWGQNSDDLSDEILAYDKNNKGKTENDAFATEYRQIAMNFAAGKTQRTSSTENNMEGVETAVMEPVFMNIRNLYTFDMKPSPMDAILENRNGINDGFSSAKIYETTEHDGTFGRTQGNFSTTSYSVKNGNQIKFAEYSFSIPDESNIQIEVDENTVSELFNELKSLPGVSPEQALEMYKQIYSEQMMFHKDPNLKC